MNETGKWQFAPAYDLTYSPKQGGYHSLSVANQYKEPRRKELLKLANHFSVERAQNIIDEVKEGVSNFDNYAAEFEINRPERNLIKKALETKLKQLWSNKKARWKSLKTFASKYAHIHCYRTSLSAYREEILLTNVPLYGASELVEMP